MMATGNMATDVGTVLYGAEAVESGLWTSWGAFRTRWRTCMRRLRRKKRSAPVRMRAAITKKYGNIPPVVII